MPIKSFCNRPYNSDGNKGEGDAVTGMDFVTVEMNCLL